MYVGKESENQHMYVCMWEKNLKISICMYVCIHMLILRFFSHIDCYRTLSVLPYAVGPFWL